MTTTYEHVYAMINSGVATEDLMSPLLGESDADVCFGFTSDDHGNVVLQSTGFADTDAALAALANYLGVPTSVPESDFDAFVAACAARGIEIA